MNIHDHVRDLLEQLRKEDGARVRIALFGQPGAGKSSLINALTGQPLAKVGVHTDTTTECAEYEWGQLILADLPGYGTERFPKESYFETFKILSFDLFLCVTANKLPRRMANCSGRYARQGSTACSCATRPTGSGRTA